MCFRRSALAAMLVGLLLLSGAGCGSTAATTSQPPATTDAPVLDTARVARIDVPDQIATSDTLRVHLSGTVGPNGCYALARIDEDRTPGRLTLTPRVRLPTADDRACTMAIVPLDTTHVASPPFEPGRLAVRVPQGNQPAVTDTITVTDRP
ncbi:hypothetical protein [Salinibacter ruber]|uniref:hypothetical protein n=1 Tax=Salinibacter ruber TaxID=146919 RepID=UPI0021695C7B|nr:hypothetical protein [Salinibacter ruber]MCS4173306.1 putative small lipoprotein YifL [Salinibacter ruber]